MNRNRGVVLASSNPGKLAEIRKILASTGLSIQPQQDLGVQDPAETGSTFVENAIIKARHASRETGLPALADDSGLCVDALNGEPGVRSARYAGENASDADNIAKLLQTLGALPIGQRTARFQCVIVLLRHADDPMPVVCSGTWEGSIQAEATGANGFGYDPVFHVPGRACSAAELDSETKNRPSHRGRALAELKREMASSKVFIE